MTRRTLVGWLGATALGLNALAAFGAGRGAASATSSSSAAPANSGPAPAASSSTTTAASAAPVASAAPDGGLPSVEGSCIETMPPGKERPSLSESFPEHALSGHALTLTIGVAHGKGERVLPGGFHFDMTSAGMHALEKAGFYLPDADGGAGPTLETEASGDRATTTLRISFVALPPKPGRHTLTLPSLPIALARASGEIVNVCSAPHDVVIDDPIASTPHARPRDNPEPRRQLEEWTLAKQLSLAAAVALVVGGLASWLIQRWRRRPKPVPPPPPPRPPWEVALEELFDIRHARLIEAQRYEEHFDRVSHTIRRYLGDRYGFDGLESTTREILGLLRRVTPPIVVLDRVEAFMRQADLVKFARLTPTEAECETALGRGEEIVHRTVPAAPLIVPPLPVTAESARAAPVAPSAPRDAPAKAPESGGGDA